MIKRKMAFKKAKLEGDTVLTDYSYYGKRIYLNVPIKNTMCHLGLKAEVCNRHSCFGCRKIPRDFSEQKILDFLCSRSDSILKDGVFVKFLDIIMIQKIRWEIK